MDSDFRVGNWVVRPERLCIHLSGKTIHVTPKAMGVLECLARANGDVVSRNDLLDTVWPGAAVTDDVLTQCIVELRRAFDDSPQDPQFIETIPKKGFRVVATVAPLDRKLTARTLSRWPAIGIAALVVIGVAAAWYLDQSSPPPPNGAKSIAVVPFTDLSPEGDQEHFVDGLTDELIARLMLLDGLQVTGRASSFYFKDRDEDVQSIGEQLRVGHLLGGSVRRAGDEVKVIATLTDVSSGYNLWSDTYERRIEDLFEVQERIAEAVATALSVGLGVGDLAAIEGGTKSVAAYEEYIAGNAAYVGANPRPLLAAEHYQRATELDPNYALAWARLAETCHSASFDLGHVESLRLPARRDRAMAMALSLAPDSAQVLTTAVQLEIWQHHYREARLLLDDMHRRYEGREIPYNSAYLDLSLKMGRLGDSYRAIQSILRHDPLNPWIPNNLGQFYHMVERHDEALAERERGFQSGNRTPYLENVTVPLALASGRRDEIEKWLNRAHDAVPKEYIFPKTFPELMLENLDDRDALLEVLAMVQSSGPGADFVVALWAAYLGDDEMALKSLQRSPDPWTIWSPLLKRVRETEEFKQILIDAGIVDYWREFGWGNFCTPTEGDDFECH